MNSIIFKRAGALILSSAITLSLLPKVTGNSEVKADDTWSKTLENTFVNIDKIANPVAPENSASPWSGSYVYYGHYDNDPIRFRVLDNDSDLCHPYNHTLFLDGDQLYDKQVFDDDSNVWEDSTIRKYLNGEFLNKNFTPQESAAIEESTVKSHDYSNDVVPMQEDIVRDFVSYTALNKDKVFLLDFEDVSNPKYGYHKEDGKNHIKEIINPGQGDDKVWFLRTGHKDSAHKSAVGTCNVNGTLIQNTCKNKYYAAPALNIPRSKIMMASLISGTKGKPGAEYKLTVRDDNIKLSMPSGKSVTRDGNTVTVPYSLSGENSGNVDQLSVAVFDISNNGQLIYYQKLDCTPSSEGTVSFDLPSGFSKSWGTFDQVCLMAEDVNGMKETDYSSDTLLIPNPELVVDIRQSLFGMTEFMQFYGVTYILNEKSGVVQESYENEESIGILMDLDANGDFDIDMNVKQPSIFSISRCSNSNLKGIKSFDTKAISEELGLAVDKITFILSDLAVSLDTVKNGSASLSKETALPEDEITVTVKPDTGYELDKVTYTPEGGKAVDITDTKSFVMPNSDVKVNVTFKKTAVPTVTATPAAKPSSNPTAGPASGPIATAIPTAGPTSDPSVTLTLNKDKASVVCGKTDILKATLKGATGMITWTSSDPKVAAIDANGKVTAKMAGATTITATAAGKSASCVVTVLYKDVTNSKDFWYAPTNYLTAAGVVKGYDKQTKFKPANKCTRAQMVTFIWRLQGEPKPKTSKCKFSDVKKTDYFYKACIWGNENHIVEGYKDGTFGPQIVCARKHAVTFLWRLANKPKPSSTKNKFKDVKKSDYFYTATLWASEKKILAGYSDGTFRPNGDCLRRQMVTFLYKYDKYINNKG